MPLSNYMPDLKVEIAFNAGFGTDPASRTWTDVSQWVELAEGMSIKVGRQDERSSADANELTLTLDNSDGRFTPARSGSPYYPNVKLYRPIRVTATPVGGSAVVVFLGFVTEWPHEWPEGVSTYSTATLTAVSRIGRLGLSRTFRSYVEEINLKQAPDYYWTLGDSDGSTVAAESSGNNGPGLAVKGTVTFGDATGLGTDGLTAMSYTGTTVGKGLTASISTTFDDFAMGGWFAISSTGIENEATVIEVRGSSPNDILSLGFYWPSASGSLGLSYEGFINGFLFGDFGVGTASRGVYHHIGLSVTRSGTSTTMKVYLDGVQVATETQVTGATTRSLVSVQTTFDDPDVSEVYGSTGVYNMSAAHMFIGKASTTDFAALYAAQAALAGQTTAARVASIRDLIGGYAADWSASGVTTMTYASLSGQTALDALRDAEDTEAGIVFDDAAGLTRLQPRTQRYQPTAALTLDMAQHEVESDLAPKLDPTSLANLVTATSTLTAATAQDTASQDDYGVVTAEISTQADELDEPAIRAAWWVNQYAQPTDRLPNLAVDVLAATSPQTVLGLTVSSMIRVNNMPSNAASSTADYFVEGWIDDIGPESWVRTFNTSPAAFTETMFVLDSATLGKLDTGRLAL